MSNGYYLFQKDGQSVFYSITSGIILALQEGVYETLRSYQNGASIPMESNGIVNVFEKNGLLLDLEVAHEQSESEVAYLSFAPVYGCNFRCKYCFAEFGNKYQSEERSFEQSSLYDMLDFFFEKAFPNAQQYRLDFVSGGEPLLRFETIRDTILYIEKYQKKSHKKVSIWLCTNGSLLTDEIVSFLSEHNVSIGISIDGRKEKNDKVRVDVNGQGTYDRICHGISLVHTNPNATKRFKNLWGLCTATNENCDFVDIIQHMHKLGFFNLQIRLIRSHEAYDLDLIKKEYSKLRTFLLEQFSNQNLSYLKMILNDNDQYGKVLKRIILNQFLVRRCNAGLNKISICPDGSVYPCDSFVGIKEYCMGNIHGAELNLDRYKKITIDDIPQCKNCTLKFICGGDCYYNSYMKNDKPDQPDAQFCELQKYIIEESILLCLQMQNINSKLYQQLIDYLKRKEDYVKLFG